MKQKLSIFTDYTKTLYPHEIGYLLEHNKIEDEENLRILSTIEYNSLHPQNPKSFDDTIDKRKYSNLKRWIEIRLAEKDVDRYFVWLSEIEQKILTDSILPIEEKALIKQLRRVDVSHYHFTRLYEVAQHFRDYLLIRMRIIYYNPVSDFLDSYRNNYRKAAEVQSVLNDATYDIISRGESQNPEKWVQYLAEVFRDKTLDAYTRYRAVVRLMYVYYNYRRFDDLKSITLELDQVLKSPHFYSKRILANYYGNRAMMHQKRMELDDAEKYGYLSVRQKNKDYLYYVNILCGVLVKQQNYIDALKLMHNTFGELKNTNSFFNRIGFVSLYVRTLVLNGKAKQAADYAKSFFEVYRKEIFSHRWHLFFEAYTLALLRLGKYRQLISLVRRNDLVQKEKNEFGRKPYLAVIRSFYLIAEYLETEINEEVLRQQLEEVFAVEYNDYTLQYKRNELKKEINEYVPGVV